MLILDKSIVATNQSAKLALSKSKSLLDLTDQILKKKDDEWMERILEWSKLYKYSIEYFPKEKKDLVRFKSLQIEFYKDGALGYLPNEIGMLKQLEEIYLHDIVELPDAIINLRNLKSLTILWYYCEKQGSNTELISKWISELKSNGCQVFIDCDYH